MISFVRANLTPNSLQSKRAVARATLEHLN